MRAPHSYCVAVRKPSGEIVTEEMPLARMSEMYKIFRYPVLRGLGTLYQALKLGGRALRVLRQCGARQSRSPEAGQGSRPRRCRVGRWRRRSCSRWCSSSSCTSSCRCSWSPSCRTSIPVLESRIAFNAVDGVIRLLILLTLLYVLSRTKDIRRVFAVSRRGAQSGLQLRIGPAGERARTRSGSARSIRAAARASCSWSSFWRCRFTRVMPVDTFVAKLLIRVAADPGDLRVSPMS